MKLSLHEYQHSLKIKCNIDTMKPQYETMHWAGRGGFNHYFIVFLLMWLSWKHQYETLHCDWPKLRDEQPIASKR